MAEEESKKEKNAQTDDKKNVIGLNLRLIPAGQSDHPVLANFTTLNIAPGMVFIDFGFLEPGLLASLPRLAKSGGKIPENINGRLAVRVAVSFDVLQNLHQQIGRVVAGLQKARGEKKDRNG